MSDTLRDRIAAVLGSGNDDTTAYAQADAILEILAEKRDLPLWWEIQHAQQRAALSAYPPIKQ